MTNTNTTATVQSFEDNAREEILLAARDAGVRVSVNSVVIETTQVVGKRLYGAARFGIHGRQYRATFSAPVRKPSKTRLDSFAPTGKASMF